MSYVGTLQDNGSQFDSNATFETQLGVGGLVRGFEEGVLQMTLGQKAFLLVTADYAYADFGVPSQTPGQPPPSACRRRSRRRRSASAAAAPPSLRSRCRRAAADAVPRAQSRPTRT